MQQGLWRVHGIRGDMGYGETCDTGRHGIWRFFTENARVAENMEDTEDTEDDTWRVDTHVSWEWDI